MSIRAAVWLHPSSSKQTPRNLPSGPHLLRQQPRPREWGHSPAGTLRRAGAVLACLILRAQQRGRGHPCGRGPRVGGASRSTLCHFFTGWAPLADLVLRHWPALLTPPQCPALTEPLWAPHQPGLSLALSCLITPSGLIYNCEPLSQVPPTPPTPCCGCSIPGPSFLVQTPKDTPTPPPTMHTSLACFASVLS